jgi:Methylamine utilisation protein MauE
VTGIDVLVAVAALTTSLLLSASAVAHLRRREAFRADLAAHSVPPGAAAASPALPAVELATGVGAIAALAVGRHALLVAVLVAQAATFATFAGYLGFVVRAGRAGLPCGCGLPDVPVGPAAIGRAGGMALVAVVAAAWTASPSWTGVSTVPGDVALVATAGVTLAVLAAVVPSARRLPATARPRGATS